MQNATEAQAHGARPAVFGDRRSWVGRPSSRGVLVHPILSPVGPEVDGVRPPGGAVDLVLSRPAGAGLHAARASEAVVRSTVRFTSRDSERRAS